MRRVTLTLLQSMKIVGWTELFDYLAKQCDSHNIRSVVGTCEDDNRIISYSFGDDSKLSGFIRKFVDYSPTAKLNISH